MREIKFRVWDEQFKRMSKKPEQIRLNIANGNVHGSRSGGNVETWRLMQYTGLKDKNGVEIYEGDILKVRSLHYEKDIGLDVVCFEKGCFCLRYEYWSDGLHKWKSIENYDSSDLDVVGNVHQNPDLLRKEQ